MENALQTGRGAGCAMAHYTLWLETLGPVFVGSGDRISKKEYIFVPNEKRVYVPDLLKMQQFLQRRHLLAAYEDYLLHDFFDFAVWLRNNNVSPTEYKAFTAYVISSGDAVFENRGTKEILTFQKDAYGVPYVPGSSLKGALRTILLGAQILENPGRYSADKTAICQADLKGARRNLLRRETERVEQRAFYTLGRNQDRFADAVNDQLAGLRVSDSKPLRVQDLLLCQKVDVTTDGQPKPMPILRECLRPGCRIEFELSIDPRLCPYTAPQIERAAQLFVQNYQQCFRGAFPQPAALPQQGLLYLGGGCGYATKTMLYPLLGAQGIRQVSRVIDATLPYAVSKQHGHSSDLRKGASPHMLKCTRCNGRLYEMGACRMTIL